VPEAGGDVLGRGAGHGDLEVVNDAGAVQRDAGHESPLHEVDDHRREADLDDVGAETPEDGPAAVAGAKDLVAQGSDRLAREHPGQRLDERGHRGAAAVRPAGVGEGDLARAIRE